MFLRIELRRDSTARYEVRTIPALVVVSWPSGEVLSSNGRGEVAALVRGRRSVCSYGGTRNGGRTAGERRSAGQPRYDDVWLTTTTDVRMVTISVMLAVGNANK